MKITCIYCQRVWHRLQKKSINDPIFDSVNSVFSFDFCQVKCIKNHIMHLNITNPYYCTGCNCIMTSFKMKQFLDKYYDDSLKLQNNAVCSEKCYQKVNKKEKKKENDENPKEPAESVGFVKRLISKFSNIKISNV